MVYLMPDVLSIYSCTLYMCLLTYEIAVVTSNRRKLVSIEQYHQVI